MPRLAQPAGSDDAQDPVALLGSLVKAGILRFLRENPNRTAGEIADALELGRPNVHARLGELVDGGLVIADRPRGDVSSRGVVMRYHVDNEAVTDLYLRLGLAIGEF